MTNGLILLVSLQIESEEGVIPPHPVADSSFLRQRRAGPRHPTPLFCDVPGSALLPTRRFGVAFVLSSVLRLKHRSPGPVCLPLPSPGFSALTPAHVGTWRGSPWTTLFTQPCPAAFGCQLLALLLAVPHASLNPHTRHLGALATFEDQLS